MADDRGTDHDRKLDRTEAAHAASPASHPAVPRHAARGPSSVTYPATAFCGGVIAIAGCHVLAPVPLEFRAPLDAAALGLFCVVGAMKALIVGCDRLPPSCSPMSAIGGGVIRDVLLGAVPTALRSNACAVAALRVPA